MSNKYTTYVGLDVHALSVDASGVDIATGETFHRKFTDGYSAGEIAEWLSKLPQPVYCAYESGCTGFVLARGLRDLGYDCDVIAVSTLPRSSKDRQRKCDKNDARAIRREITNPDHGYTVVAIPDERTEAESGLVRAYGTASDALKTSKQRVLSFLLLKGFVWNEKTKAGKRRKSFTREFYEWLATIHLEQEADRLTLESHLRRVRQDQEERDRLKEEAD